MVSDCSVFFFIISIDGVTTNLSTTLTPQVIFVVFHLVINALFYDVICFVSKYLISCFGSLVSYCVMIVFI